jgi:hypothetical protein
LPTLTFAGDASGDVSCSFEEGATRYFVFALVATEDPDRLCQVLAKGRCQANRPETYEYKFHSLSSIKLRQKILTALSQAEFETWVILVEKTTLPDLYRVMNKQDLYLFFCQRTGSFYPL